MHQNTKSVFGGIDYIRVTYKDHKRWGEMEDALLPLRMAARSAGVQERVGFVQAYYGSIGEHYFLGKRDDGMMVQISGAAADSHWHIISRPGAQCSRIDCQVTLPATPNPNTLIENTYSVLSQLRAERGKPVEPQISKRPSGALMVTYGSRQSEAYGRCYDKFRESKQECYRGYVRFEVELKGTQAQQCHTWLLGQPYSARIAAGVARGWWERRGVTMDWKPEHELAQPPKLVLRKTREKKLAWLAAQISPTIDKLVRDGYAKDVAEALLAGCSTNYDFDVQVRALSETLREAIIGPEEK